jgi:hypothetical protein
MLLLPRRMIAHMLGCCPHLELIVEEEEAGNAHSEQQLHRDDAKHLWG